MILNLVFISFIDSLNKKCPGFSIDSLEHYGDWNLAFIFPNRWEDDRPLTG